MPPPPPEGRPWEGLSLEPRAPPHPQQRPWDLRGNCYLERQNEGTVQSNVTINLSLLDAIDEHKSMGL